MRRGGSRRGGVCDGGVNRVIIALMRTKNIIITLHIHYNSMLALHETHTRLLGCPFSVFFSSPYDVDAAIATASKQCNEGIALQQLRHLRSGAREGVIGCRRRRRRRGGGAARARGSENCRQRRSERAVKRGKRGGGSEGRTKRGPHACCAPPKMVFFYIRSL